MRGFWATMSVAVVLLVAGPTTAASGSTTNVRPPPCSNLLVGYGTFSRTEHPVVPSGDTIRVLSPTDRYDEDIVMTVETAQPSCTDDGTYYSILVQDERDPRRYLGQSIKGNGERFDGRAGKGYVKFDFDVFEDTDGTPCVHLEAHGTWKGYSGVTLDRLPDVGCFDMRAGPDETVVSD